MVNPRLNQPTVTGQNPSRLNEANIAMARKVKLGDNSSTCDYAKNLGRDQRKRIPVKSSLIILWWFLVCRHHGGGGVHPHQHGGGERRGIRPSLEVIPPMLTLPILYLAHRCDII